MATQLMLTLIWDLVYGCVSKEFVCMVLNTPESRTRDLEEKKYGLAAKDFLVKWTNAGGLTLKTYKDGKGKFGRILGELWYGEVNINEKMIEEHHAVRYMGQSKDEIAEQHIANRSHVNL